MDLNIATAVNSVLTKADLIQALYDSLGLNRREAGELVERCFELMVVELSAGREVHISGFGNFQLKQKPARPGRNLRTGEAVAIAPRRVVTFHASQKLRSVINTDDPL